MPSDSLDAGASAHQDPQAISYQDAEDRPAAMDSSPDQENISVSIDNHVENLINEEQGASPSRTATGTLPARHKKASPKKASERPRPLKPNASSLAQDESPVIPKAPLDTFGVHQDGP